MCASTLTRSLPPSADGAPARCPVAGEPGWQGDPPALSSDFAELVALPAAASTTGDQARGAQRRAARGTRHVARH
eukprot:2191024-Prymnesium_polylepis.1